jgi:hypothetical protein
MYRPGHQPLSRFGIRPLLGFFGALGIRRLIPVAVFDGWRARFN